MQNPHPSFFQAFQFWFKLGWISFGGPTGQIAIMHQELVEKKKWISENRFLHALNYCMILPGPEAQQLAIYIGWLLHRTWGGIIAGFFFVIPSIFILVSLSWIYVTYGKIAWVNGFFYGLKPAVLALVAFSVIRIAQNALKNYVMYGLAGVAFICIFVLKISFPMIIIGAGLAGFIGGKLWPKKFNLLNGHGKGEEKSVIADDEVLPHTKPTWIKTAKTILVCLTLWIGALILLAWWRGEDDVLFKMGIFFSKAAMVTFGGAYAVLTYLAQQGVEVYHWLNPQQMMDGLGLAETTPGPLIMVVAFVGYLGATIQALGLPPELAGILGGLVATYFTFLPCFLWIFLGAPFIEQMRGNLHLNAILTTITASVVGVVLNLGVFFGTHTLFPQKWELDWVAFGIALVSFIGLWKFKWNVMSVILGGAMIGVVLKLI